MFHELCRKPGGGTPCFGGLLRPAGDEKEEDADKKPPRPKPGSGWINDVVARAMLQEAPNPVLQLLQPRQQRRLLESQANFDYEPIVEAVNSENLQQLLLEVAVRFWKKSDPDSSRTLLQSFLEKAQQILGLKRKAALLKDESEATWRRRFIIQTLKEHRFLENRESSESRLLRYEGFWPQYHQVCRNAEELAELVPPEVVEAESAESPEQHDRQRQKSQQLAEPLLQGAPCISGLRRRLSTRSVGRLQGAGDWKTRSARSRRGAAAVAQLESQAMTKARSLPKLLQDSSMEDIKVDAHACKKLRHAMIRRPVQCKANSPVGSPKARSPKAAKQREVKDMAAKAAEGKAEDGTQRAPTVKEVLKPSHLLKSGNIQSWGDLGLGSLGFEARTSKEMRRVTGERGAETDAKEGATSVRPLQEASQHPNRELRINQPDFSASKEELCEPDVVPVLKRPTSAAALRTLKDTTAFVYLQECEHRKLLPRPAPIVTGHSSKLDARHQGLTDSDLAACSVPIVALEIVESVDLEGNAQLTDKAIADFLVSLGEGPGHSLTYLSLRGCDGASFLTINATLKLLASEKPAFPALQHLDLSGLKFGVKALDTFCLFIGQHRAIRTLLVADIGLGSTGAASSSRCLHRLLASQSLRELDLGWNVLDAEVFMSLGRSVQHSCLSCLRISSCASIVHGGHDVGKPAASFLEYLSNSCPLRELDISFNHIDYRAALVLEDLLSANRRLTALDISFNPIGPVGMRSFARLLTRDTCGLTRVRFEGCASGKLPSFDDDLQFLNVNIPGGTYSLQLDRPDHRSTLRMLYRTCDALGVKAVEAFSNVHFSEGAYKHPEVGADAIYAVRTVGRLQAIFKIEMAVHHRLQAKEDDFATFMQQRNELLRLCPSDEKQVLLLHAWRSVADVNPDQGVFLDALARDILLPFPLVLQMCKASLSPALVVSKLFPAFRACATERSLSLMIARSITDMTQILQNAHSLMFFNIENPTGRYRLDLSSPSEYSIAEALVLLDSWEASVKKRRGKVDTSQTGDWSQVRNVQFRDCPLQGPMAEWLLPEVGKLELDYSSSTRPPSGAQVLDDASFQRMLIALQDQDFRKKGSASIAGDAAEVKLPRNDMQALRMVAHRVFITALQTRALLECFLDPCDREDCLVTFFNRIADMHNEKVFSVRFEGDDEQIHGLRRRLGALVFFPWIQPEQAQFAFQLGKFDERTALCLIINLAKKERMTNVQKPRWVRGDGTMDPLTFGLPRSWETFSQIPSHGTVYISYKCAPEDRNFKARRWYLETYSNWPCDVSADEVLWWASTNEVPVDVMEFLEFVIERYDNVYEAFDDIKSNRNGNVLNLRDFEEGLKRVKCKKFSGKREAEKITGIFRYLDPSGEGQVTRSEWGILELCHKEMVYSIQEFVQFCQRSFGNDLNAAWAAFDVNGDNLISEKEWETVARNFSYFGPTLPIFRFLDRDDEGTICFEEFEELQKFREPPRPDVKAMMLGCEMLRANSAAMQELPSTRVRVRARLARARAAVAGGWLATHNTALMDEVIKANLKALPKSGSSLGPRVVAAFQRLLAAHGIKAGQVNVMKVNSFKDGLRELRCDIDIPQSASPCAVVRLLERALFTEEAQKPESVSLLHVLRAVSAQISTLQVEIRPSRERIVTTLRLAIPKVFVSPRSVEAVMEAALKTSGVYRPVLEVLHKENPQELAALLSRPSACLCRGNLVAEEWQMMRDTCWHGVKELSGLLAISLAAHLQLKELLAPGARWGKTAFGDQVSSKHPWRKWKSNSEALVPNAIYFDPGVKTQETLCEEVLLAQRVFEQQDTAAHDLMASRLHIHFETLADLCAGLDSVERSLDVVWLRNRFREPDCFGYPCVQMGVRQMVQDPRHLSRDCTWAHVSKLTFHCTPLFQAKMGHETADIRQELHEAFAGCGIHSSNYDLAEAAVRHAVDSTEQQLRRSRDLEVDRVMAFLERYAKQIGPEERAHANALLTEAAVQAQLAGCATAEIQEKIQRCLSSEVQNTLGKLHLSQEISQVIPSPRPVLNRIAAVVSQYKVESIRFCFRDGSEKVSCARTLVGDVRRQRESSISETREVSFDLTRSDYVVAVEQGAVGNSGSLGAQVLFFTASGRTLHVMGLYHRSREQLPSRVRVDVHAGEQIVGLEVEFGRIVGIDTALEPAVGGSESDEEG